MKAIKLTELPFKQKAKIKRFTETNIYVMLMEMGCVPDEEIEIELSAPLGDPLSIKVAGYHLSIRKEDAESIWVELITPSVNNLS